MELTPDQQVAFDAFQSNNLVYVSGPAGTGKSFLIHYIQEDCRRRNIPYKTLSSTGISAHHIEGMTVHGFICRRHLKLLDITPDTVFIMDEISMLGKKTFDAFELELRKSACTNQYFDPQDRSNPFGGYKIIFFGDFAQLPPIDDSFCFTSNAWSDIAVHCELTTIKRQADSMFKQFLSRVRIGKLLREDKEAFETLCRRKGNATTHLFLSNKEAEEFNRDGLEALVKEKGHSVMAYDCIVNAEGFTKTEQEKFFNDRHQFYQRLVVCEGAKCMLTANINVEEGWCNGTLGTIVSMTDKEIIMKSENGKTCPIPRREYTRVKHRSECDVVLGKDEKKKKGQRYCGRRDCNHTPIYTYVDNDFDSKEEGGTMMEVQQFPILLAWGITIHKSQGMTLSSCTITLPYLYSPSLLYVALSRCTSFETLSLKASSPIRYDLIVPSTEVMTTIFGWTSKTCSICHESYIGPYARFCQDCSSAPGKHSFHRFIDFIPAANPSPDMLDYISYVKANPTKSTTTRWKKFLTFITTNELFSM